MSSENEWKTQSKKRLEFKERTESRGRNAPSSERQNGKRVEKEENLKIRRNMNENRMTRRKAQ